MTSETGISCLTHYPRCCTLPAQHGPAGAVEDDAQGAGEIRPAAGRPELTATRSAPGCTDVKFQAQPTCPSLRALQVVNIICSLASRNAASGQNGAASSSWIVRDIQLAPKGLR